LDVEIMNWIAAALASGLLIYLTYAMLRPEHFA
jgi:K+-transporting ATPase KdpF subunit